MRRALSWLAPFAGLSLTLGCTSSIDVGADGQKTGTTTTSTATTGTTTSGTTGTGGGGTGGGGTGGGTGGTGGGCTSPVVTVVGDGATKAFDFLCQGSEAGTSATAAAGYIGYPSPHSMGPEQIWINGCATAGGVPLQGSLSLNAPLAMVGTSTMASVTYDSGTDTYANSGTGTIQVTELDADTIAGTYSAAVQPANSNNVTAISGTFKVCRAPDFLPP